MELLRFVSKFPSYNKLQVLPSYRNESTDFVCKSIDWLLYQDNPGI